jgi:outer membrane protein OmpA-like peptidoglycan-associated protein
VAVQSFRVALRCKRCQWNLTAPQSLCKKCGIAPAYFIKRELDFETEFICRNCNNAIAYASIPHHCRYCGSLAYDWWDYQDSNWLAPNLKLKRDIKGIWVIGRFEGDFVGTLSSKGIPDDLVLKENYHRDYDIKISQGHLIEYEFTDRRPKLPIKPDPKPIRQNFSNSILVKDLNSNQYLPANLADLVIYDWHRVSEKEFLEQNKIAGHIKGTLCACLVKEEEFEKVSKPIPEVPISSTLTNTVDTSTVEQPVVPQSMPVGNGSAEAAASPPTESFTGNSFNPQVNPPEDIEKPDYEQPTPPPGSALGKVLRKNKPDECLLCNSVILGLLSFLLFFYFRSDGKWGGLFWCHLVQALFFFFVTKAVCVLEDIIQSRKWTIVGHINRKKYRNFLIGVALISLLVAYSNINKHTCYDLSSVGIWEVIVLICFVLSAFVRDCFTKTILAVLFAYVVMLTMSCNKVDCHSERLSSKHSSKFKEDSRKNKDKSVVAQLLNTKKKIENTYVEQSANLSERKVKSLTGASSDNKKITTSDLTSNPNLLADCSTSVYLGELGLFERNSFTIKETAATKLEQLASWMAEQDKSKKFIITGHADKTGEWLSGGIPNPGGYVRNMRLSKQRAEAVAQWILENEDINEDQLLIRGVGSSEPLTTDEDTEAQKINIRVELKANCETESKSGH